MEKTERQQNEPRLSTSRDWLLWTVSHADYYTVVRFLGVGQYQRSEHKSFTEALRHAKRLVATEGGQHMIYAVAGPHDAYILTVNVHGVHCPQKP